MAEEQGNGEGGGDKDSITVSSRLLLQRDRHAMLGGQLDDDSPTTLQLDTLRLLHGNQSLQK